MCRKRDIYDICVERGVQIVFHYTYHKLYLSKKIIHI